MKKKISVIMFMLLIISVLTIFSQDLKGKKVLYIDSYHAGYAWSDGITKGISETINKTGAELKIYRMDTKRNGSEDFKKQSALKAKQMIDEFKQDIVLCSDDNSVKYVLLPYYKDSNIPFIHCAVNWDDTIYGLPFKNTTGMIEVSLYSATLIQLKDYAKGARIGFLSTNNETEKKESEFSQKNFGITYTEIKLVNNFEEWKTAYKELQNKVDMVYCINNAGIQNWNDAEAESFVLNNSKVPSASHHDFMAKFVLITYAKLAEEQGTWVAETAIKVLKGTSISSIPEVKNKTGKIYLNMKLANKMGIVFKPALLKNAEIIK